MPLRIRGFRDTRSHGSIEFAELRRRDAEKDLRPHMPAIKAIAEKLYLTAPEPVSGAVIRELWELCQ